MCEIIIMVTEKTFQIIKKSMPRLYRLKIDGSFPMILSSDIVSLEQIRILDLSEISCSLNNDNIDLSSLFPYVERLTMTVSSFDQMAYLIDLLVHLSSGSFHIINNQSDISDTFTESDMIHQWLIEKTDRLTKDSNFTYRLDSQADIWIHMWIGSENIQLKKVCYNYLIHFEFFSIFF